MIGVAQHPAEHPLGRSRVADHRPVPAPARRCRSRTPPLPLRARPGPIAIHQLAVGAGELARDRPNRPDDARDGSTEESGPSGSRARLRRARRSSYACVNDWCRSLHPRAMISACSASRSTRHAAVSPRDAAPRPSDAAVERDPAHHLAEHVVPRLAAHLPDARSRAAASSGSPSPPGPRSTRQVPSVISLVPAPEVGRLEHLAVDVELQLAGGAVADSHRATTLRYPARWSSCRSTRSRRPSMPYMI